MYILHFLFVALSKVHVINTFSQSSAVNFFSVLNIVRQPGTLDSNVFDDATVARYPVPHVVALPVDILLHLALDDDGLDQRLGVVIVSTIAGIEATQQAE